MSNPKGFYFAAFLAIVVFSLQNIDGRQLCRRKNYYCPNTTISIDSTNLIEVRAAQRKFVIDVFTSRFVRKLTPCARDLINNVLSRVNTDSPRELSVYFGFALWSISYLANCGSYPSLCLQAANVNSSVNWATIRNGNLTATTLRQTGNNINVLCLMTQTASLLELGCDTVPDLPNLPYRCFKRGLVYAVEQNLELNGQRLPCCIYQAILDLYVSKNYVDNMLAAIFSQALTPESIYLVGVININSALETSYLLLNNNVSVCCCPKRSARYDQLCIINVNSANRDIETLINERFLFDECATQAP